MVDALGRRTPTPAWLAAAGVEVDEPRSSDCGVVYYSRYYRQRPGFELPDGPWVLSPRGDLGYCGYATFPGDNGALAALLSVPRGVQWWRGLNDPTSVRAATATVPGLVAVGDAFGHTDPVLAHGLAFALMRAAVLTDRLARHDDDGDVASAYDVAVRSEMQERYDFLTALDAQRLRMWLGEDVDFAHRDGDYALFSLVAAGAASMLDPDIARMFLRRIGLLDSTSVLDEDVDMQQRVEQVFAAMRSVPRPAAGPSREEMVSLVSAHG